jgi:hypothetical protein
MNESSAPPHDILRRVDAGDVNTVGGRWGDSAGCSKLEDSPVSLGTLVLFPLLLLLLLLLLLVLLLLLLLLLGKAFNCEVDAAAGELASKYESNSASCCSGAALLASITRSASLPEELPTP